MMLAAVELVSCVQQQQQVVEDAVRLQVIRNLKESQLVSSDATIAVQEIALLFIEIKHAVTQEDLNAVLRRMPAEGDEGGCRSFHPGGLGRAGGSLSARAVCESRASWRPSLVRAMAATVAVRAVMTPLPKGPSSRAVPAIETAAGRNEADGGGG